MNGTEVMRLVTEILGVRSLHAEHMTFGHNSITYDVTLPDRNVIVRTNQSALVFARTEHNLRILARLGLPVPHVIAADFSLAKVPFAYMILEKIPGRDLRYELAAMTHGQMTRLAEQIVSFQRSVETLPLGTGYGYVAIGEQGPHASWWDLVRPAEAALDRQEAPGATDQLETRVRQQMEQFEPYFREVPPTCFLDDITVKNVIVQNGVLQGLVDFDCVCYGDPLYWMALTATGVVCDVGTAELFYVKELERCWRMTELQTQILRLYSAAMAVWFMRQFGSKETPEWSRRMVETAEQWLGM